MGIDALRQKQESAEIIAKTRDEKMRLRFEIEKMDSYIQALKYVITCMIGQWGRAKDGKD